ncbi:MAG: hypothetical protein H3C62_03205 [Gemmatimonadaceae bacterium]|nr:hypothetical protein [Gemmatimonadaceae bacterium]
MPPRILWFVLAPFAVGQAQSTDDAAKARPERPTVATHAVAVAPGYFEVEAGVAQTRYTNANDNALAIVAKFGVARRAQLTIASAITRPAGGVMGADPVFAGLKWQLGALREGRPLFALLPGVTFANGPRRGRTAAVSLTGIVSRSIGPVAIDLNAAATQLNDGGQRVPYMWAASFGGPVKGAVGWGLEASGSATRERTDPSRLLAYVGYTVRPSLVLDAGASAALRGRQGTQVFAGVTWNAGKYR